MFLIGNAVAQKVTGQVFILSGDSMMVAEKAMVSWIGTGVYAITDSDGNFEIDTVAATNLLAASFVGYKSDTLGVEPGDEVRFYLYSGIMLKKFVVRDRHLVSIVINKKDPRLTLNIDRKEFQKAACCNLSESFETNAAVDVTISDAITGLRQIQMLGLSGNYVQTNFENLSGVRGLSTGFGMTYIPGSYIESMQLTKGTGSVVYGFESMTGMLNIEFKKPFDEESWHVNGYTNQSGRSELNFIRNKEFNENFGTSVLAHASGNFFRIDVNRDGFMNTPVGNQLNLMNRWHYRTEKIQSQIGFRLVTDERTGGQMDYNPSQHNGSATLWGYNMKVNRAEVFGKTGLFFTKKEGSSLGLMYQFVNHNTQSYFGMRQYQGSQSLFYTNLIYKSYFGNTNRSYFTGISFMADNVKEQFGDILSKTDFNRREIVPGAFFEYTWKILYNLTAVAGIRADYHNLYGFFTTPRLNICYTPKKDLYWRLSGGKGLRTPSVFNENMTIFTSSRQLIIADSFKNMPYGLKPEIAWNFGGGVVKEFKIKKRKGSLAIDYYYTIFINQIVADRDASPDKIILYGTNGEKAFSSALQVEWNQTVIKHLEIRAAYRMLQTMADYRGLGVEQLPFVAQNRYFFNAEYTTYNKWSFDFTAQVFGTKRIPSTLLNPENLRMPTNSPIYLTLGAQVSKKIKHHWQVYCGVENLNNFVQKQLILNADSPFSQGFDASLIWGPSFGRMVYAGFRYIVGSEH